MTSPPIHGSFLAAYANAGLGVASVEYGIPLTRLSIIAKNGRRERPSFMMGSEYLKRGARGPRQIELAENFVTMLLSYSVGRVIGLERHLGYPANNAESVRLVRALRIDALQCLEWDTDLAYAVAFGWLACQDAGNAKVTLRRLWSRASELLRQPPKRAALDRLAEELLKRRAMDVEAVQAVLRACLKSDLFRSGVVGVSYGP